MATDLGQALYQLLPNVYRERDNSDHNLKLGSDKHNGDLARYLAACGELLDNVYNTLEQRLADAFPDTPEQGRASQEWLLPYFADLLDVRLVSPHVPGRRDEIANAVSWRQAKGTLATVEDIAEAVGQVEVEVQEGWRRVAVTPRLNTPLLPAHTFGYGMEPQMDNPSQAARHPGLPAICVDFRCPSRSVQTVAANPAAQSTHFDGEPYVWRQASRHGAPCFPGSYEDVSRRTVDLRTPDWRQGHYHPRRLLLHAPPAAGLFPSGVSAVTWKRRADSPLFEEFIEDGVHVFRNSSHGSDAFMPLRIRGTIELHGTETYRFIGLHLDNTLLVHHGRVELIDCAARKVELHTIDDEHPVLTATSCLIKTIQAARGLSLLVYCTVLQETLTEVLDASDCIFLGRLRRHHDPLPPPPRGCVRYSRIPQNQSVIGMSTFKITRLQPVMYTLEFGRRACGVLHPATPEEIRFGAEDGGELGAYHDRHYSLQELAMLEKLKDFLPVGMEAVLIPDARLLEPPPAV